MENLWYLIEVSGCVTAFYSLYFIFFKHTTFFSVNRIYLLSGLLFAFIIPALNLSIVPTDYHTAATNFIKESSFQVLHSSYPESITTTLSEPAYVSLILTIYWIGFALMISRLVVSIVNVLRIKKNSIVQENVEIKSFHADITQPFSFFNLIFLPRRGVNPLVWEHEKAHVQYCHWIDLLLLEVTSAILWFNPIMILYRKSLKIQHEYAADAFVLTSAHLDKYLNCVLLNLQVGTTARPISQFNSINLKQRILMMTKNKTSRKFSFAYLLFIPLGCLLLFAFSNPSVRTVGFAESRLEKDGKTLIIVDAGHGGTDKGAHRKEGVAEKDLALAMAKSIQRAGEANNITVVLTRTGDEGLSLEERVSTTSRYEADVFISLHSNYHPENASASGIECIVSEKNGKFDESKLLAEQLVQQFQTLKGISVNGVRESDYFVLSKNTAPAILLELGYLSNNADYAYLADPKNLTRISESIIAALVKYKK